MGTSSQESYWRLCIVGTYRAFYLRVFDCSIRVYLLSVCCSLRLSLSTSHYRDFGFPNLCQMGSNEAITYTEVL